MSTTAQLMPDRLLAAVGLLDGSFDGRRVRPTRWARLASRLWTLAVLFALLRMPIYVFVSRHHPAQFYAGNFFAFLDQQSIRMMFTWGMLLLSWSLCVQQTVCLLSRRPAFAYWMRFFAQPDGRPAHPADDLQIAWVQNDQRTGAWLIDLTADELRQFRQHSRLLVQLLSRWFPALCFCLAVGANSRYHWQTQPIPRLLFWPVYLLNTAFILFYPINVFTCTFGFPLYMSLLCRMLTVRFENVSRRFRRLASQVGQCRNAGACQRSRALVEAATVADRRSKPHHCCSPVRLRAAILSFQLATLDLLRVNRFWSKIFLLNYLFGLVIIVMGVFSSHHTGDVLIAFCATVVIGSVYLFSLFAPIVYVGGLVDRIKKSYRPAKQLLLMPHLSVGLKRKLIGIIEFMRSRHCGFTCGDLFLIERINILQVSASIVVHLMLAFELAYLRGPRTRAELG